MEGIQSSQSDRADKPGLRLSVIVTTYNNPNALTLVLAGLERQSREPFELLIADDGSGEKTRETIESFTRVARFPVHHVWHPDNGFRKCEILNKAIRAARGDYLVFLDGDCVPPRRWLETHAGLAAESHYLAGGAVFLSQTLSDCLTVESIMQGDLDRIGLWWWKHVKKRRRLVVSRLPGVRYLFERNLENRWMWHGGNSSAFARDVRDVNGFDERFSYGFEDEDFGCRLVALGIRNRSVRYTCPVFHLEHSRPYASLELLKVSRKIWEQNRAAHVVATPYGLEAL